MVHLLFDSKFFSVSESKYPSTIHFPGIVPKINSFNIILALNCDRCVNIGEPAAVFGLPLQIKVVEYLLQETTAAGLLGGSVGKVGKVGKLSKVSEVIEVGWNDVKWLHECMNAWVHGGMGE